MAEPRPNPNNTGASFNLRTPSTPTLPTSRAFTPSPRTPGNPLSVYGTEFAATPSGSAAPGTPLTAFSDSVVPGQNHDTPHHITENRSNAPPSTSALHPLLSSAWLNLVESGTDDRNLNRSAGRRRDQPRMQLEEILKSKADVLSLIHYAEDLMSSLLDRIAETVTQARNAVIPIDRNQLETQRRRHASFGLDEYLKMLPQLFKRLRIIELVLNELLGFQAAKPSVEDVLTFRDEESGAPLSTFEDEIRPRVKREQWNEYVDLKDKLLRRDAYIKTIIDTERAFLQQVNCISHP